MKRIVKAAETSNTLAVLEAEGIDTTKMQYELRAEKYERYEPSGATYKVRFSCPGDYLAYVSMYSHSSPSIYDVEEMFGSIEDMVDALPDVGAMCDYATSNWYGDGDDTIYYLKNLTTNEFLYDIGDSEEVVKEDNSYNW